MIMYFASSCVQFSGGYNFSFLIVWFRNIIKKQRMISEYFMLTLIEKAYLYGSFQLLNEGGYQFGVIDIIGVRFKRFK